MHAEIISTGTEIIRGNSIDTNFSYISRKLLELGINTRHHYACADDSADITNSIKTAFKRSDVIILTGGLGPTLDDYTRSASAKAFGTNLIFNSQEVIRLKKRFKKYNMKWTDTMLSQCYFPKGSTIIPNPVGSAAGFYIGKKGRYFFALPGVPREMKAMLSKTILPKLKKMVKRKTFIINIYKTFGIKEVELEDKIKPLLTSKSSISYGLTAKPDSVNISVTVNEGSLKKSQETAVKVDSALKKILGNYLMGGSNSSLEEAVCKLLIRKNLTISVAESFTGGLIADKLTNIPGISASLLLTVVAYSNESKIKILKVHSSYISKYGAVSEQVALGMARGIQQISKSDIAVATTGIAGPSGATKAKPIGLSYIALYHNNYYTVQKFAFSGSRADIKERGANWTLNILRMHLLEL